MIRKLFLVLGVILILSFISFLFVSFGEEEESDEGFVEMASLGSFKPELIKDHDFEEIKFHTAAICNQTNFCQDYGITCVNNELVQMVPIEGAFIQHDIDWIDPRGNFSESDLCL